MCGLFGVLSSGDGGLVIDESVFVAQRDLLAHRGPDDSGGWSDRHAMIGHRRLAIMDPAGGHEPFVIGAGTVDPCVVVFNGELLGHQGLRRELEAEGAVFRTSCDAETAAVALARWGELALDRFRGMFAVAWYRPATRRLCLARDPLGVVPLLHTIDSSSRVVFSSELGPILAHLGTAAQVDPETVATYLATIRITMGDRTLVRDVRTVRPGHLVRIDLDGRRPRLETRAWWTPPQATGELAGAAADEALRAAIEDSLEAHLQSDVEVCSLLSGGIDSAVLTRLAVDRRPKWRTFTATGGDGVDDPDRLAARAMAETLGLRTVEVGVSEAGEPPLDRWRRMIRTLGVPLGTPNEIAINALAESVRDAGVKVAISGEGADELLGGYEPVLRVVAAIAATSPSADSAAAALMDIVSWISPSRQVGLLADSWREAIDGHSGLVGETARAIESGGSPSEPRSYLHWLQQVNLTGLLGRLNHAGMLASVEARPPFADRRVVETVARIATEDLFTVPADPNQPSATKIVLRRAFAGRLPAGILARPKASFPTPFAPWATQMLEDPAVQDRLEPLLASEAAEALRRSVRGGDDVEQISPMLAWPLANLGSWSAETGLSLVP